MDNKVLAEMIREKYYEEKMTAEYKIQLNKVVEMEDKFIKGFSKDKWKEYLHLDIEKGQLHSIEVDQIIEFVIKFLQTDQILNLFFNILASLSFDIKCMFFSIFCSALFVQYIFNFFFALVIAV